ncbi:hypothetical protein QLH52_00875 [Methylomonas sp. OY6]|uniref:Apea-like HEPN domain-containing protein n=1 Tax=Methylomonas defluvii TaxID=3045149 RepID=A0ABU4U8S0_9GAMM|nr:hypothetical protein [Methylomonas sp. OY6]MDX8125824.1 hypothetical protein [Methylomonas sp. OY6]
MFSQEILNQLAIPIVSCPCCQSASSEMIREIQQAGRWGEVQCRSCKQVFEIETAIDEGLVNTCPSCYALWVGGKQICVPLDIASGKTEIINIKGEFEEVYIMSPYFEYFRSLAGGFATKYIPQGYAMFSLAPNPNGEIHSLNGYVLIQGRAFGQPQMSNWKRMLLNAKLSIYDSPNLTIITALNAVDLFLEELTNKEPGKGRPGSWNLLIKEYFGTKLSEMPGIDFQNIEKFVRVRNELAHGRDYLCKLPDDIKPLEEEWLKNGKLMEGVGAYAPSAAFALKIALEIIRSCRRIADQGKYIPIYN